LKKILFYIGLLLFILTNVNAQKSSKINVEYSDFADRNQDEIPDALLLRGNVRVRHEGILFTCNKAYFFEKENYLKAFGEVQMVQGDTLFLNSKYAEYNGELKKAFATGNVIMRSPESTLVTDTINFDRNTQEAFYNSYGTITNRENTLKSKSGRYFANEKKFKFLTAVTITNPKYTIKSNHLDYYTNSGHSYLFGPSTITSKENFIYTEKGFYDTKKNFAYFKRKSYIKYKDRKIEGDSLYYDRNREYASATNNVKVTDTINKGIIKGHYAEIYRNLKTEKDSMMITKRAVAITLVENDSMYIHGKKMLITGKVGERVIRGFNNVRFYKTDMSGKCDSIHSNQKTSLTKLINRPILWNYENQMTGDIMHLIGNNKTEKLDSLKVLNNAFIISKDTIGTGYNQVKGMNLYGKFKDNKLYEVDVVKNTEVIYYMRNDQNELIGINKSVGSKINLILDKNTIDTITIFNNPDGDINPEKDFPENTRKLRGFIWRGDERIKSKDDIFPPEENELDAKIQAARKIEMEKENVPLEPSKETLDYDKNNSKLKSDKNKSKSLVK
jgi:lipopolysaccharide export system protein LptA